MLKTALRWTLIAFVVLALLSMLALWSWGRFAARAQGAPTTALAVAPAATALDRLVQPLLSRQPPDASGAAMLGEGVAAFVARAQAARVAERSLDVQYYIWRHD
nr:phospholipase D family protein [Ottowia sp.]